MPRRRTVRAMLLTGAVLIAPCVARAQTQASEKARVMQTISGTEIELEYYRPSARGRATLFGGVVPWGEVWTPGANYATTLRASKDVVLNGVAVPAGKYGLWIHLVESGDWTLVVHADTARFHMNHPTVEDGLYRIPVRRTDAPSFVETLTFSFERVRATGAELQLNWGDVRVPVTLEVDPGFATTVAEEVAAPVVGTFWYDDSVSLPTPEDTARWLGSSDSEEGRQSTLTYIEELHALPRPREVEFRWDRATGVLTFHDPLETAMFERLSGGEDLSGWSTVLIPRGEGVFALANGLGGELADFDPEHASLIELRFDDQGRAVGFTQRRGNDEIAGTAERREP